MFGSFEDDEAVTYKWSCNVIRKKIQTFLATKEMTQTAWLKQLQVNSNSFGRFMKLKGTWNGVQNGTMEAATRFFLNRVEEEKKTAGSAAGKKRKRSETSTKKTKGAALDVLMEKVAAESGSEETAVYSNCDEVRKQALEFIAEYACTQKRFLEAIGGVNSNSWNRFLKTKGKYQGASNSSYTCAYAFLEKVRKVKGTAKSAKRKKMEKETPGGHSTEQPSQFIWRAR